MAANAASKQFALRPMERRENFTALEGGFRVYFCHADLKDTGLRPGDLCRLRSEQGVSGLGIAWEGPSATNKPVVRVTELFRETYGFSLTDRISAERATQSWRVAETVSIAVDALAFGPGKFASAEELAHWASVTLGNRDGLTLPMLC